MCIGNAILYVWAMGIGVYGVVLFPGCHCILYHAPQPIRTKCAEEAAHCDTIMSYARMNLPFVRVYIEDDVKAQFQDLLI